MKVPIMGEKGPPVWGWGLGGDGVTTYREDFVCGGVGEFDENDGVGGKESEEEVCVPLTSCMSL